MTGPLRILVLLLAAITVLIGLAGWAAFRLTAPIAGQDMGQGPVALGLGALGLLVLMGLFIWLAHRGGQKDP
ncbi:MAG TPA: hypothetical protein VEY95_06485 [Azospirillaceae bacterium]|nr:hypothetical protein [Azospirillaceae bacterium]